MRVPTATYRLQLHADFPFDAARELVPYLAALGVSHLYLSPVLQSRAGSTHGYDVTDPARVRDELGGEEGLARLASDAHAHGMGILLDIVPNHMAASVENPWWEDVLRFGQASRHAASFDVDWEPARAGLAGKVLLPVLTAHYGEALERGELRLRLGDDGLAIDYGPLRLPLAPHSQATVLGWNMARLARRLGEADPGVLELASIVDELTATGPEASAERSATQRLARLVERDERIAAHVEANVRRWNGRPGDARSFDLLDRLLEAQSYRVAYWPVADQEINYRRFFDVNDLVALRVEDEHVFDERMGTVLRLVRRGTVDGLRVDHVDGLHDPARFLGRLRGALGPETYLVVEKILAPHEELPAWPVQGTTGYEVLNAVNDVCVDARGLAALGAVRGGSGSFADEVYAAKRHAVTELFGGELRNLASRLGRLAEQHRHGRDLTLTELGRALVGVTAALDVYRTYVDGFQLAAHDREAIEAAVAEATRRDPGAARAIGFMRHVLLLDVPARTGTAQRELWLRFVMRWQQLASAAMAKGQEDTAFYRHVTLLSRNEVGGHPEAAPLGPAGFHAAMAARGERWPHALSATATHDTKRGADVRARIDVLAELAGETADRFADWRAWAVERAGDDARGIDADTALLVFQTLIGAWPLEDAGAYAERIAAYVVKAAREAKRETSWRRPNERYEAALATLARAILDADPTDPARCVFAGFAERVADRAVTISLAQALLTLTVPGVPDLYQGDELWDLSLVDPDNRRRVDYTRRRKILDGLDAAGAAVDVRALRAGWRDGALKLHVLRAALRLRRERADLFARGRYEPTAIRGARAADAVAFQRVHERDRVLTVVPRVSTDEPWSDTALRLGTDAVWHDVLSSRTHLAHAGALALADVLRDLPVALLVRTDG